MTAYYNEIDPYAAAWLRNLIDAGVIPRGDVDERSIEDVRPSDLVGYTQCHFFAGVGGWAYALRLAGWPDDRPVWTGSCPCQPYSAAGARGGNDDPRALWWAWRWLLDLCRPAVVAGEQVASRAGRAWCAGVRADLEAMGYGVGAADLCAAGVGAPQIRQRLWWIGQSSEKPLDWCANFTPRSRVGDAEQPGLEGHAGHGDGSSEPGRVDADAAGSAAETGGDSGVADGEAGRRSEVDPVARGRDEGGRAEGSERPEHGSGALNGQVADRHREGLDRQPAGDGEAGSLEVERGRDADGRGGLLDPWSDAVWIPCADGKARRIEPGIEPLAHGASFKLGSGSPLQGRSRVAMLRAYGNAIVPQVAAEFICAYMEASSGLAEVRSE